jgi:cytochrome P450
LLTGWALAQTIVSVFQWAINRDERYFKNPYDYVPERWMDTPEYKSDQLGK